MDCQPQQYPAHDARVQDDGFTEFGDRRSRILVLTRAWTILGGVILVVGNATIPRQSHVNRIQLHTFDMFFVVSIFGFSSRCSHIFPPMSKEIQKDDLVMKPIALSSECRV
jgi:hypothetical protein